MTEEEKLRAALESQMRDNKLRSIRGGDQGGSEYMEMQVRINRASQEQFISLCKELLLLGAVQVNCGIFQAIFERKP